MAEALRVHDDAMAVAVTAHDGGLFKHTGDGVAAAFGSARQALEAAIVAQATAGLPVRRGCPRVRPRPATATSSGRRSTGARG